ncbi:YpjP family protein [Ureibacillus aquaedulcis]|uniref:YpjP family protein n=1 Tax=Ureibacillus aquaedulcis TaxID=3058421 RepID=A0ABT8GMT5_9BACL|nr:YpjP family protein [Ureibacillus sp. BA0131]MDN4492722.1 YpjP family protein [Ureibacillus sp. BA0131]
MKKWLQKTLVITVALLTFGLITPNHEIWDSLDNSQANNGSEGSNIESNSTEQVSALVEDSFADVDHNDTTNIEPILLAAKEQAYIKFGPRIAPVISDEFDSKIYPKLEEVIELTLTNLDADTVRYLAISNQPSGEYNEKIFNISNGTSGKDLIRFHVRTEKRPQEGYYYNFHYHTSEDNFIAHHSLGDIYWSKNTPPKWLS